MTHIQSLSQDKNEKNTTWLFSGMWNKFVSLLSVLSHTFSFLLSLCVCLRQPILPFSLFVCLSLILNPSFPPCVCVCVSLCLSVYLSQYSPCRNTGGEGHTIIHKRHGFSLRHVLPLGRVGILCGSKYNMLHRFMNQSKIIVPLLLLWPTLH